MPDFNDEREQLIQELELRATRNGETIYTRAAAMLRRDGTSGVGLPRDRLTGDVGHGIVDALDHNNRRRKTP